MFKRIEERVRSRASAIASRRAARIAEKLKEELPRGISAEAAEKGVRIAGRGLRRILALRPAVRALLARLK